MKAAGCLLLALVFLFCPMVQATEEVPQMEIAYMADWPALPNPLVERDWLETARRVTLRTMQEHSGPPYFPATRYEHRNKNVSDTYAGEYFLTRSYLNDRAGEGEAVTQLAAVLTMSMLDGLNARDFKGRDIVRMAQAFYNQTPDGRGFVANSMFAEDCPDSFWYTLYPTLLYFHLASRYPLDEAFREHMRAIADTWLDALAYIDTWDVQGISLKDRIAIKGTHPEPEGGFGAAYVLLMAHERFGEPSFLDAAMGIMEEMAARQDNPYYEILGSYAPYIAARMNAQYNAGLPLGRMLDWVFTDGALASRTDWGIISGKWGEYDAYGLSGSLSDLSHGYAFAMNTFVTAGALAPVARYAPEYSRVIGRYILAAANNSQMFLSDGLPLHLQDDGQYIAETGLDGLVYEGLRNQSQTVPFATGDIKAGSRSGTNFSFYSAGPIGMLYTIISNTNVPGILCVDLLKTDFWHQKAFPTYLLYNPLPQQEEVAIDTGAGDVDVFDAIKGNYLLRNVKGQQTVMIPPDEAVQIVLIPAGFTLRTEGKCLYAGDTAVIYQCGYADLSGMSEGALLKKMSLLPVAIHLPEGDSVTRIMVTYGENTLLDTNETPEHILLEPGEMGTGLEVLRLNVETASGRLLSCYKGIGIIDRESDILHSYDAAALHSKLKPDNNYSFSLEDEGLKIRLNWGGVSFDTLAITLIKEDNPYILIDVPHATGRWGLQCVIQGNVYYIRADSSAEGEFLCGMNTLLQNWGIVDQEVSMILRPFAEGTRDEVVFKSLEVIKGGRND